MKKTAIHFTIALALLLAAAPVLAQVAVDRIILGTGIEDREPTGAATEFPADVGGIYCFTHVAGMESGSVTHNWIYKDRVMAAVKLNVGGTSWRTWSRKTIDPIWTGDWKVEVVNDADGSILTSIAFTVTEQGAMAEPGATEEQSAGEEEGAGQE